MSDSDWRFLIFADAPWQAWKLQPTLTNYVNIIHDPPKMLSYQQVGSSETPELGLRWLHLYTTENH